MHRSGKGRRISASASAESDLMPITTSSPPIRQPCPPGTCICNRDALLDNPAADPRILLLTQHEEKRLLARLENCASLDDLRKLQQRMEQQLGLRTEIAPGHNEVRSMRGIRIVVHEQDGLCRKIRQSIPAAIRRGLERNPEVAYELLNEHDLLRGT